jgi:hypothetical protein
MLDLVLVLGPGSSRLLGVIVLLQAFSTPSQQYEQQVFHELIHERI